MLGFRAAAGLCGVPRGDIEVWTDRRGYRNEPHLADTYCPVVVTGDSYMDQGLTNADTPAGQLSRLLDVPVYDHTCMAAGPSEGLDRVLRSEELKSGPPKVLVWGFVGRSVHGRRFHKWPPTPPKKREPRTIWQRLEQLRKAANGVREQIEKHLTRWSMLKRWAVAVRAEAVYRLTGGFIPVAKKKVLFGQRPGGLMLFFAPSVRRLAWTAEQRRLAQVAEAIESGHAECARRAIHLVVLLVPDKGHVYRRWLKPEDRPKIPKPDTLTDLEARLARKGIHVVNLLPVYLARSRDDDDPLLYYPDDTHWNDLGIGLAMQTVSASLKQRGIRLKD